MKRPLLTLAFVALVALSAPAATIVFNAQDLQSSASPSEESYIPTPGPVLELPLMELSETRPADGAIPNAKEDLVEIVFAESQKKEKQQNRSDIPMPGFGFAASMRIHLDQTIGGDGLPMPPENGNNSNLSSEPTAMPLYVSTGFLGAATDPPVFGGGPARANCPDDRPCNDTPGADTPEPSTLTLAAVGLALVAVGRRRK